VIIDCLIFFYVGIFQSYKKVLHINDSGIYYIINNKIRTKIPWENLKIVTTAWAGENKFSLAIYGLKKEVIFDNAWMNASLKDLITAFNKILEYQPKYKFKVKDEAGWKI